MFPPNPDQLELMRRQEEQALTQAIEMQTQAFDVTERKIAALKRSIRAQERLYDALAAFEISRGNPQVASCYEDLRQSEVEYREADLAQVEMGHQMEGKQLHMMKSRLEEISNPSPLVGVHLRPRLRN